MSHNSIIRKIIVKLHLYTGLILGLIITLICLSGCQGYRFCQASLPNRVAANFARERKARISTS